MTEKQWPYNLPIWRHSHRAASPDGRLTAEIKKAYEVSMGNPTSGTLQISAGIEIENCNPSFLWSDDSRYLVVPQFFTQFIFFRKQRLLIIDVQNRTIFAAPITTYYFQPASFSGGRLVVTKNPTRFGEEVTWDIPEDLRQFKHVNMRWTDA